MPKETDKQPTDSTPDPATAPRLDGDALSLEDVKGIDSEIIRRIARRFLTPAERTELDRHEIETSERSHQFPQTGGRTGHSRTAAILDHDKDPHDKDPHDKGTHGRENHSRENHSRQ